MFIFFTVSFVISGTVGALVKEEKEDRARLALCGPGAAKTTPEPDQTMEMLMSDLDPDIMAIFTKQHSKDATEATLVWENINFALFNHLFTN